MRFSIFTFKLNEQEEKIIKNYAELNTMTISEFFRLSVLEKFEADMDLSLYREAVIQHESTPTNLPSLFLNN